MNLMPENDRTRTDVLDGKADFDWKLSLDLAAGEYETLNGFYLEVYRSYFRLLFFSVIVLGAVAGGILNFSSNISSLSGIFSIFFTFLINTWFAGWAYMNLELWSYRFYLGVLESFIHSELKYKHETAPFSFYSSGLMCMYKKCLFGNKLKCHIVLDVCFAVTSMVCYISSLYYSVAVGVPQLAGMSIFPRWMGKIILDYGGTATVLVSVSLLVVTLWAKTMIQKEQRAAMERRRPFSVEGFVQEKKG